MSGEAHVYFTAFSSGRKALVMFCAKWLHIQQWNRCYFLARYLPSNFIGKDGVRAKSQIRFLKSLTGVLTGRKNKRDIFYPARTSVLIIITKNLSKLDI